MATTEATPTTTATEVEVDMAAGMEALVAAVAVTPMDTLMGQSKLLILEEGRVLTCATVSHTFSQVQRQ